MTDHHDNEADRRLDQHKRALLDDLGAVLDIEAGLREILLQSRHDTLLSDLGTILDVEAGLSAILPPATPPLPAIRPDTKAAWEGSTAAERFFLSVSPQVRVALRVHPDVIAACRLLERARDLDQSLDHGLVLARLLTFDRDLAADLARALDLALARARDLALHLDLDRDRTLALARARDLARILDRLHDLALVLVADLDRDFDRAVVHVLGQFLSRVRDLSHDFVDICITEVRRCIAGGLDRDLPVLNEDELNAFLDDFTTTDLRTADLDGIDLGGVRWSELGTRWPAAVDIEGLKTRSEEAPPGSGIYVVRSGTASMRGLVGLL
ncbi:hypothetical protein [Streptomyces sp. NPDC048637]|uniref:hypothetical protein n=1 Tax=Streptomyces sp. NPDC048637 TaxID=3155636 RepID=UPI0034247608